MLLLLLVFVCVYDMAQINWRIRIVSKFPVVDGGRVKWKMKTKYEAMLVKSISNNGRMVCAIFIRPTASPLTVPLFRSFPYATTKSKQLNAMPHFNGAFVLMSNIHANRNEKFPPVHRTQNTVHVYMYVYVWGFHLVAWVKSFWLKTYFSAIGFK